MGMCEHMCCWPLHDPISYLQGCLYLWLLVVFSRASLYPLLVTFLVRVDLGTCLVLRKNCQGFFLLLMSEKGGNLAYWNFFILDPT